MPAIEVGRVCMKTKGRDAGHRCVIVKVVDDNTVIIRSKVRKKDRRCSIRHIDPLPIKVDINNQDEVEAALNG
ncbi:50S ribosomal protein L14e [Candidatus Micrarchaeota archaeon]|nr:50S ribosomal protein L14e [Candidatus Micrarchaeota archaeon]